MALTEGLIVASFALVHLFAGKLRFLDVIPRSRWLSMAGGISVAYVFIHVFPELEEAQRRAEEGWPGLAWLEHHAYLMALGGLILFYGLEHLVKTSRKSARPPAAPTHGRHAESPAGLHVFWLHVSSFAVYNALIGYLLVHREEATTRGLVFYAIAMALHFLVNDYGLRQHHRESYRRTGRWILAAATLLGWLAGILTELESATVDVLFAFLAGGVILNVLKEELPEERQSRFLPFAAGAASYTALLLVV